MKIKSIKIEEVGQTRLVTVMALFHCNEEVEEGDIARLTDQLNEAAGADTVSHDTTDEAEAAMASKSGDPYPEDAPKPKRKRRTKAEMEAARAAETETDVEQEEEDGVETTDDERVSGDGAERPVRRRRRGTSDVASADENSEDGNEDTAPSRRRRRRGNSDDAVGGEDNTSRRRRNRTSDTTDDGTSGEGETSGRSRRRSRGTKEDASAERKITAADLAKAASEAAQDLGPAAVKAFVTEFEVDDLSELDEDQKAQFIDGLAEMMEE